MDLVEDLVQTPGQLCEFLQFVPVGHGSTLRVASTLHHDCATRGGGIAVELRAGGGCQALIDAARGPSELKFLFDSYSTWSPLRLRGEPALDEMPH